MGCSMQPIFSPFAQTQRWKVASHLVPVRSSQEAACACGCEARVVVTSPAAFTGTYPAKRSSNHSLSAFGLATVEGTAEPGRCSFAALD